eukprot:RCo014983
MLPDPFARTSVQKRAFNGSGLGGAVYAPAYQSLTSPSSQLDLCRGDILAVLRSSALLPHPIATFFLFPSCATYGSTLYLLQQHPSPRPFQSLLVCPSASRGCTPTCAPVRCVVRERERESGCLPVRREAISAYASLRTAAFAASDSVLL